MDEEDLESSDDEETSSDTTHDTEPIYKNGRINYATHMLLIMAFVIRHGLSGSAVIDLLSLIEIHCAAENICVTSLRLFHKYFENVNPIERHYFCEHCSTYIGKQKATCNKCGSPPGMENSYFLVSSLCGTFQSFFKRKWLFDFLARLEIRWSRVKANH